MESHLTATEAARNFSDILSRVRYRGEAFVIERGGEPMCRITPVLASSRFTGKDLLALFKHLPQADEHFHAAVEEVIVRQPGLPESPWER